MRPVRLIHHQDLFSTRARHDGGEPRDLGGRRSEVKDETTAIRLSGLSVPVTDLAVVGRQGVMTRLTTVSNVGILVNNEGQIDHSLQGRDAGGWCD